MSVFEWITEHEGFFSGLVAIAALLGISPVRPRGYFGFARAASNPSLASWD